MCYLTLIIGGVVLSYYILCLQRKQLICSITEPNCKQPDLFPLRVISSILILAGLILFLNMASQDRCKPADCCTAILNDNNYLASLLVLLAAVVRFQSLFAARSLQSSSC